MVDETVPRHNRKFSELTVALQKLEVELLMIEQAASGLIYKELHALAKSAIDEYRTIAAALRKLDLQ